MAAASVREGEIRDVAFRIADLAGARRTRVFHLSWWSDRVLARSKSDPAFRSRLFRFVDAFPALSGDDEIEEHFRAEFGEVDVPRWFGAGMSVTKSVPGGSRLSAGVARRSIDRMARQFIIGSDADEVATAVGDLWRRGIGATVDLLGENTYSESEADRYASRLAKVVETLGVAASRWPEQPRLENDDSGLVPRASVSVKVSALASDFTPLCEDDCLDRAAGRLLPVLRRAGELGVSVWFDMERYDSKELTHRLFRRVLNVPGLDNLHAGIVVQAYLRDSVEDLDDLAAWARGRSAKVNVRLVKGAYWDTETVKAAARGWPSPVFEHKVETDSNYEHLARRLLEHHGSLNAVFATHNLRSLAAAMVDARELGIPEGGYEIQLLFGMAEPLHEAIRRNGNRLRVYAPMGELVPGMGYLVRRLLENTSNESFVRHHFAEGESLEGLLSPPIAGPLPVAAPTVPSLATDPKEPGPYSPEPTAEWRRSEVRTEFATVVEREFSRSVRQVLAVVAGERVRTARTIVSVDPADPDTVVAQAACCGRAEVDAAIAAALPAAERWKNAEADERAGVLLRTAVNLRSRRHEIAALEVRETGKSWADADADVCEAIDYCEYYARRMLVLAQGGAVMSPLGEDNRLVYRGRGLCAVVSPWNFPLAIPAGMCAAALVTGNAVLLKPAEQAPAVAAELVDTFVRAGLPPGVLSFLPGTGEEAGEALVGHPEVDTIAFTGSRDVGLSILETATRRQDGRHAIARVVAELGGKNAILVDADADLDEVVPAVVASAFGFAGQKCSAASRLVVVERAHDAVVERLVEAARSLAVGPPRSAGSQVGPVIDEEAYLRLRSDIGRAGEVGTVLLNRQDVPDHGWFVGPAVVADVDPSSWLATQELFGPVLATFRAQDFDSALTLADSGDYALTAGVFTRSPGHVRDATRRLHAGNIYVNRPITGAVVGRQPFGGTGMSGVGAKAGGPDYLMQFVDSQVVTENTVRQGFAPEVLARETPGHGSRPPQAPPRDPPGHRGVA